MANLINKQGKNQMLYSAYTDRALSTTLYNPASKFQIGVDNGTVLVTDTSLNNAIPITNGTINDDGDNQLTGSSGGDNTTDNTTTFKQGGNVTDDTAQNLIANDTNATKVWTISDLSTNGTVITITQYGSIWLYIKDATTLAKFKTSGTCLEVRLGSDGSNYYSKTVEVSELSIGWNWIQLGIINTLTETGTVGSPVDYFEIEITTNNATDEFVAGDVVYDLLRTWTLADTKVDFVSGYPSIDYTNNEVTTRCYLTSINGNGFDINSIALLNEDTAPLVLGLADFTSESKERTDEFTFIVRDRLR